MIDSDKLRLWVTGTVACLTLLVAPMRMIHGQDNAAAQTLERLGSEFVPIDAMVAGMFSPAKTLKSPTLKLFPVEVAEAWCIENIGVPLSNLQTVKAVVGSPGPGEPMFGAIFQFRDPVDLKKLNPEVIGDPIEIDGLACVTLSGPPGVVLHQVDDRTIVAASINYLGSVISAKAGPPSGPLAKFSAVVPHRGTLTILFAVEPVRPLITGLLQSQINQIPPPLVELTRIPELLDAVLLRVDIENSDSGVNLTMLARDDASAEQLQQIISNGLVTGREIAMAQLAENLGGDGPMPNAMKQYYDRVADKMVESVTPKRDGRRLTITAPLNYGSYYQLAVLAGIKMPDIQPARVAAGGATSMNNMKQIALAMHNHHAAYLSLPDQAIRDDASKPLLSWRVKILPFIEEQALYEQFRLDEPWDSDHNIKLIDQMPEVYQHPTLATPPGTTVYQVPLGDGFLFGDPGARKFRAILDGLSNSIMMVQTDAESAVRWTEPSDWEVDPDRPFVGLDFNDANEITVLIADGSVRRLNASIGVDKLKALLTIAGFEKINLD